MHHNSRSKPKHLIYQEDTIFVRVTVVLRHGKPADLHLFELTASSQSNQCTKRGKALDVRSTWMTLFFSYISVELRVSFLYHKVDTHNDEICKLTGR